MGCWVCQKQNEVLYICYRCIPENRKICGFDWYLMSWKSARSSPHHLFSLYFFSFLLNMNKLLMSACFSLLSFCTLPFSAGALHVCYLSVAIPPGTGRWLNLWPPERESESRRPRGLLGVEGQLPAPFAKPAMGTTASIHIQILPGGRSKEAIDGGMEE